MKFNGKPSGSQNLAVGSLVPAGPNRPMGFRSPMIFWPSGVSDGLSAAAPLGIASVDPGPAHVPDRSRFGAGPPSPAIVSCGEYTHGDVVCLFCVCLGCD